MTERRAGLVFWICIASMIAALEWAGALARRWALSLPTTPDARFPAHYSVGATMPFPVIMDHDRGAPFLGLLWTLVAVLAVLSLVAAGALRRAGAGAPRMLVLGTAAVAAVATLFPITFSLDAYAYAAFGRLLSVDGANPYVEHLATGARFADPVLAQLAGFLGTPLPSENYGALWTWISGAVEWLCRSGGVALAVWAQRALGGVALIAASAGVLRMLRSVPAGTRAGRAALFALHPLAIYESAAAGHNDMLMIAPAVWAVALAEDAPLAAGTLLGAAIAVKYVALLALPFLVIRSFQRSGARTAAAIALPALLVPAACMAALWPGAQAFAALLRLRENVVMSPTWLVGMLAPASVSTSLPLVAAIVVGAVVVLSIVQCARRVPGAHLARSLTAVLWGAPLFNPWYVLWLLPAAVAQGRWARYAWWLALLAPARYVEDALRFPATASALASRVALLEAFVLGLIVVPIALAVVPRLPFQGDARAEG